MLIEIAIATAAAGLVGLLTARAVRRRRALTHDAEAAAPAPAPAPADALSIRLGDVVQHEGSSRWLRCRITITAEGRLFAAMLLARESGREQAVVVFAPPEREVLWLERTTLTLPPSPPGRLEIGRRLLDRSRLVPAEIACDGHDPPALAASGLVAFYEGAERDAAVVLRAGDDNLVYHGLRLAPEDHEVLGRVDPSSDELGTA